MANRTALFCPIVLKASIARNLGHTPGLPTCVSMKKKNTDRHMSKRIHTYKQRYAGKGVLNLRWVEIVVIDAIEQS